MAYSGGIVAAAAAAEKRRRMLFAEEEGDMTQYTRDDLKDDWEFKIVRSDTAAFRRPEVLNKLLEEETQAGWVMVEKLDDSRIRFKRPRSARAKDAYLPADVDPYRTRYGTPSVRYAVLVVGVLVGLVLLMLGLLLAGDISALIGPAVTPAMPILFILIVFGLLLLFKRKSR